MTRKIFAKTFRKPFKNDVIIYVGEDPDFKKFNANSNTLRSRSDYFERALSAKDIEKKDGKYVIKIPNITPQIFKIIIIKYFSAGYVNFTNKTGMEILNIIIASGYLELSQLIKRAEDFLIKNRQQFLEDNPVWILQMVYYYKSLNNIQEFCLRKICFDPKILFNSDKFTDLPDPLLEIILKRNDINLDEIEIWENLIKWGIAQEITLYKDVSKWNQENFIILGRILHKFIPLIRFYDISSENYFNKVKLYEEILPKELREEILKFHKIPRYKPILSYDSILINRKHIANFANMIDKGNKRNKNRYYKFNLLYRASRDGNTAVAFHDKCDNKGATIVIAKIKNSDHIVGGYNSLYWDSSSGYMYMKGSFIFSFTNRNNFKTEKVGYIDNDQHEYSVYCHQSCGPTFGNNHDLSFQFNNTNTNLISNNPCSYAKIDIPANLNVEDYEVYQVIRKNFLY